MAKVYISSTKKDLGHYRDAVYLCLRQMQHDVIAMEENITEDKSILEKSLADVDKCEIYLGIFAWRYGYIPPDPEKNPKQLSITELEYRTAIDKKKICLLFLLDENTSWPLSQIDALTHENPAERIESFREELGHRLRGRFTTPENLAQQVAVAVPQAVEELKSKIETPSLRPNPSQTLAHEAYLRWLIARVSTIPLAWADPSGIQQGTPREVNLVDVYTGLMTKHEESLENLQAIFSEKEGKVTPSRKLKKLSSVSMLNANRRLVLLGDAGSGKSSFVKFVARCLAGDRLREEKVNLKLLCKPVVELDEEGSRNDDRALEAWNCGNLIPMCVVLREFAERGLAKENARTDGALWHFFCQELPEIWSNDFVTYLRDELLKSGGLLMLDGFDEIPVDKRTSVREAIEQFANAFSIVRILVTSRSYAYKSQEWIKMEFTATELAPFSSAQIHNFVDQWYASCAQAPNFPKAYAEKKAKELKDAFSVRSDIHDLATHPLLLTLMASLHTWKGGDLPSQRADLYAQIIDLLLHKWPAQGNNRNLEGSSADPQSAWLNINPTRMRRALNELAFEAHQDQGNQPGTADIPKSKLVNKLTDLDREARPILLIEYLCDRAGLFERRGSETYAFLHRSFQEYLAACYLTDDRRDFPKNIVDLFRKDPSRWREVTLLAGAKAASGTLGNAWALAAALCSSNSLTSEVQNETGYLGALLAAQVLIENDKVTDIENLGEETVKRIRQGLTSTLKHGALSSIDRVKAGDALATIGDPRFHDHTYFFLPKDDLLGFVEIEEGPFLMGSDGSDPQASADEKWGEEDRRVILSLFYMAQYPVTVAQFQAFIDDKPEYEWVGRNRPQGPGNHPAVYATWTDAFAYCDWLNEKLDAWEGETNRLIELIKSGWRVTLPSEAEWEKAARGTDGRIYPWGDKWMEDHANTQGTGIGRTSAVGSFPKGRSPYGCLDMAGNVWEWTRSLWGEKWEAPDPKYKYPYEKEEKREERNKENAVLRVRRGGSYYHEEELARCACRRWPHEYKGINLRFGFRVALCKNS